MRYKGLLTIVASILLALSASVGAAPVTIVNASFEDPALPTPDDWTDVAPPGWTQVGADYVGVWHVTLGDFDPVLAPDGQNVAYTEQIGRASCRERV